MIFEPGPRAGAGPGPASRARFIDPLLPTVLLAVACAMPSPVRAQTEAAAGWNDARALELVERARRARASVAVDSAMTSYRADARGYVYFFVDRPDRAEHVLVKADQVALDVFWRAPADARQRIIGLRDERVLPTSIRYHLDHLTVVQDDFGDLIRLGDGDEVGAVPHPVAPGSGEVYDFQLVDSLRIAYGSSGEEVRVYEVQVRPKRLDRPGFIGTVFLDLATGAIVRMNFSFTPSSYVDPYLDYIRISLDNALWLGRFWLPYRQEVELRREMPLLDFSAGSVIRSRFEIGEYDFGVELDDRLFTGVGVGTVSPAQREAFPFEQGLFDEVQEEGLTVSESMEEVRAQVREVVEDQLLTGLSPIRLHFDGLSDFARYNRAEGIFLGAGVTLRPHGDLQARVAGGHAIGRARPSGSVRLRASEADGAVRLSAYWDEMTDVGGHPGATRLENTITSASAADDYLDPYFRRGVRLGLGPEVGPGISLELRLEEHFSAADVVSDGPDTEWRPVRTIDEGTLAAAEVSLRFEAPGEGDARLAATGGRLGGRDLISVTGASDWVFGPGRARWHGRILAEGGVTNPGAPVQTAFLLGGRSTLPGQPYRAWLGNGFWMMRAEGTLPVRPPYVGIRLFGVAAATYLGDVAYPVDWARTDSGGVRGSVGAGLSLAWDTLFLDLGHGVRGGGWEAVFSVAERFRGWL